MRVYVYIHLYQDLFELWAVKKSLYARRLFGEKGCQTQQPDH